MYNDLFIPVIILIFLLSVYQYIYPAWKKYSMYQNERRELEKKYNRLYKARKDLLNHFDWASARGESLDKIESIGREIERMD